MADNFGQEGLTEAEWAELQARENTAKPNGHSQGASPFRLVMFADIDIAPRKIHLVEKMLGTAEMSVLFGAPGLSSAESTRCFHDRWTLASGALPFWGTRRSVNVLPDAIFGLCTGNGEAPYRSTSFFEIDVGSMTIALVEQAIKSGSQGTSSSTPPSNVLRGHNGPNLDDGYLARFTLGPKSIEKVEVLPIIGKGQPGGHTGPYDSKLFQPALMQDANAQQLLENLRGCSAALDTAIAIDGDKGVITVSQASK